MDILIGWSGRQSRAVAEALYEWLPKVIPSVRPWISTQDIDKGNRWFSELQKYLPNAKSCIVCLTPENVSSPWLYWETGAIALVQEHPICPLLINVTPDDIKNSPLVQFQCTYARRDDVLHLVQSLNQQLGTPEDGLTLRGRFDAHWEPFSHVLTKVAEMGIPSNVLTVIRGIQDAKERFRRRWEPAKKAESWEPIKLVCLETAADVERLYSTPGIDKRIQLHAYELKQKIASIPAPSQRENAHVRGDAIYPEFDKAIAAIRADYD